MNLAIMQPYFLPYIGYIQLINASDVFVFYDDVTYIKQGWINRNRIILGGKPYLFTLEVRGASSFKEINTIEVGDNRKKLLKTFEQAYRNAPFYKEIEPLLQAIFCSREKNLSLYIVDTHKLISEYLGIKTEFMISSRIDKNYMLKGQDKVIEISKILGASHYINSIGGKDLYSKNDFLNAGITLSFLQPHITPYVQLADEFIPSLSVIDVMMYNNVAAIQKMLGNFELV